MTEPITLKEAAALLKRKPRAIVNLVKQGKLRAAKLGKEWTFLPQDIEEDIRALYAVNQQQSQVIDLKEVKQCQSINAAKHGGLPTPHQTAKEYANLLTLPTKSKHKNCTTH